MILPKKMRGNNSEEPVTGGSSNDSESPEEDITTEESIETQLNRKGVRYES